MEFLFYETGLRQRKQELGVIPGGVAFQRTRLERMLESETSPELSPQQGPDQRPTATRAQAAAACRLTNLGARRPSQRPPRVSLPKRRTKETPTGFRDGRPSPGRPPSVHQSPTGRAKAPVAWPAKSERKKMREGSGHWQPTGERTRVPGDAAASHLRQAPAGNRAAARGRACNLRNGDPTEVSSRAESN